MKYSTYTWDMVLAIESASPAYCKTPPRFIKSIPPNKYPEKKKSPRIEIQLPVNRIILPRPMYTQPRAKKGRLGTQP